MEISIIIPTYKPKHYFLECLDSIQMQKFDRRKYEVIIILNGELEPYETLVKEYIKSHDFKATFISTRTPGVSNARNLGLQMAKGKYICFIDDDDKVSPNYLQELYRKAAANTIVASQVLTFQEGLATLGSDYITEAFNHINKKNNDLKIKVLQGRKFLSSSCCKIISREIIGDCKYNTRLRIGEDSVFMAEISKNIKYISICDESGIYYRRIRKESASRNQIKYGQKIKIIRDLILAYCKLLNSSYNILFITSRIVAALLKLFKWN